MKKIATKLLIIICALSPLAAHATNGYGGPAVRTISVGSYPSRSSNNSAYQFVSDLSEGYYGEQVSNLQKRLADEGVYKGPITGYYGPLTAAALELYQDIHGLTKAPVLNSETRAALNANRAFTQASTGNTSIDKASQSKLIDTLATLRSHVENIISVFSSK